MTFHQITTENFETLVPILGFSTIEAFFTHYAGYEMADIEGLLIDTSDIEEWIGGRYGEITLTQDMIDKIMLLENAHVTDKDEILDDMLEDRRISKITFPEYYHERTKNEHCIPLF